MTCRSETKRTHGGDQYECECPACGAKIRDLWDLGDGLHAGNTVTCDACEAEVEIEEVDIIADITLVARTKP